MKESYKITVPEPCTEDWEKMMPDACGRFCSACQKTVIDFTVFSDEDFIAYFMKNTEHACGRFKPHQLSLEIPRSGYRQKIFPNLWFSGLKYTTLNLLPLISTITYGQGYAQTKAPQSSSIEYPFTVSGNVLDEYGDPMPGASIIIKGTAEGATTDVDGRFSVQLQKSNVLEFKALGAESCTLAIEEPTKPITVKLCNSTDLTEIEIPVSGPVIKKGNVVGGAIIPHLASDEQRKTLTGGWTSVRKPIITDAPYYNREPLIVLNGKPFKGRVVDIDPAKVKDARKLYGAEATALYGAAGVDGVLIVETKRPSFWTWLIRTFRRKTK